MEAFIFGAFTGSAVAIAGAKLNEPRFYIAMIIVLIGRTAAQSIGA